MTPAANVPALPDYDREARLFWGLRRRVLSSHFQQLMTTARFRTVLVVLLSTLFWAGLFALFYGGFEFLVRFVGKPGAQNHALTVRFVFHLFFASLNVMLIFSSGIILYSGLFSSPETRFLLTTPARAERIVVHKFQEAVLFSSWGFFLLASPMIVAYGLVADASWGYFVLFLPFIVAFVFIPCSLGALLCLAIVYRLPRFRTGVLAVAALGAILWAGQSIWVTVRSPQEKLFGSEWFQETLRRFQFTQNEWLPSSWLCNGLLEAAQPTPLSGVQSVSELPIVQALMYLVLSATTAQVCQFAVVLLGKRWLRTAYSQLECRPRRRRKARLAIVDRGAELLLSPLSRPVRLLLMKDWRLLRRDPVQWTQFLIFFGLLGLYFLNVDRFNNPGSDISYLTWVNMVSFLNLAVVGLILSTFTTRFIFPMISLEGRRFWVLGLMPVKRETIVWSKFIFAAIGSLGPCSLLILLSDLMLRVSTLVVVVHQLTTVLLCLGLSSIAVGLGATMPNFREASPSKIAAGFGGTLNLVLSALYIMAIVVLTALPCHFYLIAGSSPMHETFINPKSLKLWLIGGTAASVVVGALATIIPLRRGIAAFNKLELY
jgi:ABC-2 type transport system permease protein